VDSCPATSQNVCSTDRERFIPCNPQHQRGDGNAVLLLLFDSRNSRHDSASYCYLFNAISLQLFYTFLLHYILNQQLLLSYGVYPISRM